MPESNESFAFAFSPFPYYVWILCITIVLSASMRRWSPAGTERTPRAWLAALAWPAAIVLAGIAISQLGIIHHLATLGLARIEAGHPPRWQRIGAYDDIASRGLAGITTAAAICVVVAGGLMANLVSAKRRGKAEAIARWLCVCVLLISAAAFCYWYYAFQQRRVFPDFVGGGLVGTWLDWFGAVVLVAMLAAIAAYRASVCSTIRIPAGQEVANRWRQPRMHETPIGVAILALAAVCFVVETLYWLSKFGFNNSILGALETILFNVNYYPNLALLILSIQLAIRRWRRRGEQAHAEIQVIDGRRFVAGFLAFILLAVVAAPTLAAYCFNVWLGPWYLY